MYAQPLTMPIVVSPPSGGLFDLDGARERLAELDATIAAPGFWDDPSGSQEILKTRTSLEKLVTQFDQVYRLIDDVSVLIELGAEAEDSATLGEVSLIATDLTHLIEQMEFQRMLSGTHDQNSCFVTVTPGAGGTESQDWAGMLLRMLMRYGEKKGWKVTLTDYQDGDEAGIKSATFSLMGEYAYGHLKAEAGVHRLVRLSPFDSNNRRHTSFASVFVFPEIEEAEIDIKIPESDLRVDTYRSSGAGGQHVNTTDSAVRITHLPTGIVVACQSERSQIMNRATAMRVLMAKLYEREMAERNAKASELAGEKKDIGWGSQIRSYVLHPYKMVKDLRTGVESSQPDTVLDGELDQFVIPFLMGVRREVRDED